MGLFKNMKGAMDSAAQAHAQYEQPGRFGTTGFNMNQAVADRDSLQGQAHEFNRILTVGQPARALIPGDIDTAERVGGNPVWPFDREVPRAGGSPSPVQPRQIGAPMPMRKSA